MADVKLVDTPLDINPRTKTAHENVTKEGTTGKDAETKKKSPEDFGEFTHYHSIKQTKLFIPLPNFP